MAANRRVFYAVKQVSITDAGTGTFLAAHAVKGLQSCGVTTKFNLEQVFEIGQISIYENIENLPDIEVTAEKVLDGYALMYHLATPRATTATLVGRSNVKCNIGMWIFGDTQDAASGTPVTESVASGMFPSVLTYQVGTNGPATESLTFVGNNRTWKLSSFSLAAGNFNNADSPKSSSGSGGVNRREDIIYGPQGASGTNTQYTKLPKSIPGVSSSGTVDKDTAGDFKVHVQSIKISTNLGRDQIPELGRKGPYFRYATFPVPVRTDVEIISVSGEIVNALEDGVLSGGDNTSEETITFRMKEGLYIDCGTKNRLESVTQGGGNAGQGGNNNDTLTFSYTNFNDMTVTHPSDPAGL